MESEREGQRAGGRDGKWDGEWEGGTEGGTESGRESCMNLIQHEYHDLQYIVININICFEHFPAHAKMPH